MKQLLYLCLTLSSGIVSTAQVPQTISYQAIIRNNSGGLIISQPIGLQISIIQGAIDGVPVFIESHQTVTNENGLLSIEIGGGEPIVGSIQDINWGDGPFYCKTETDPEGGVNYTISGTSQLLSVPYALYSGNGVVGVSSIGDTLLLGNGSFVIVPGISSANPDCDLTDVFNMEIEYDSVTDVDGNVYKTVFIGNQEWMAENLRTSRYRNGESIIFAQSESDWLNSTDGAFCLYDNNTEYGCVYGKLYNSLAVLDTRNICPTGFEIPTNADFDYLISFLDYSVSGIKLKSNSQYWNQPNFNTNESGFSGLPGGLRSNSDGGGGFHELGEAAWFPFVDMNSSGLFFRGLTTGAEDLIPTIGVGYYNFFDSTHTGTSVRCIRE